MKKFELIIGFIAIVGFLNAQSNTFNHFSLDNGLAVYLWEDKNQADVTGEIVVRAGAVDESEDYTGLAHYLEHVLFKGTQKIGALDWNKEKFHYEMIIKLYDQLAVTTDPVKRDTLIQQINRESIEEAKYTKTNELSNLIEGVIGGSGLNAGTSYDQTVFYNNFPAFQMEKWLDVYSERFINPVFRSFQAELENVFEEYNMYQDSRSTHVSDFIFSNIYPNVPYKRNVIGLEKHLKNPSLSKLIEFYNKWYVPQNMALVLVGNFDSEKVIPLIKEKFGRLENKPVSERVQYPKADFSENPVFKAKLSYYPQIVWAYQGVKVGDNDEIILDVCSRILNNSSKTGLLDKLTLEGDVNYAGVQNDSRRIDGRILVIAVPYYDVSQRIYESDKATEKLVMKEIDKLKNGEIDEWLFNSVKQNMLEEYKLIYETPSNKVSILSHLFSYNLPDEYLDKEKSVVEKLTLEEVQRVAKQYFRGDHVTVSIDEGKPKKNKIKKPEIKPINQPATEISEYAKYIKSIPVAEPVEVYNDMSSTDVVDLYPGVKLHYTKNPLNDIFTLTLKYGVGTKKMPKLEYAVPLMNYAGIMPMDKASEVRKQYSEFGARCSYQVDDSYFYISLLGKEDKVAETCRLMTKQILLPKLDDKQLDQVKGSEISQRLSIEPEDIGVQSKALLDYALYKDSSEYIDRMSLTDIYNLKISELTGEIIRATNYELNIYYVGQKDLNDVEQILKENLPLKEGFAKSMSPIVEQRITYDKPVIYFLPNNDAQQAKIYFYINGQNYTIQDDVKYRAFYQYFSGGFNGLVMNEIREKNSMAYTSYGAMVTPPIQNKKSYFIGYIGTQGDKAADAIKLYLNLLKDMPLYPDRISDIKNYMKQTYLAVKPSFRNQAMVYSNWSQLGYNDDPAKINIPLIDKLNFEDIVDFYNQNIKEKPVCIIITGDPNAVDLKKIKEIGKVTKLNSKKIFSNIE
ncbi:MAG: insulinase family protein [Paludibacter sp.]|nr:insulinase family protein [Paludibacter sp.]